MNPICRLILIRQPSPGHPDLLVQSQTCRMRMMTWVISHAP